MVRIISVTLLLTLALAGCAPSASRWIGTWEGEIPGLVQADKDDAIAGTLRKVRLEIPSATSFQLVESGVNMDGMLSIHGDTATLKVINRFDRAVPNPESEENKIMLTLAEDGTITYEPGGVWRSNPTVLKKVEE